MKTVTRTITIPKQLQDVLQYERRDINVSEVCTTALKAAVAGVPEFEVTEPRCNWSGCRVSNEKLIKFHRYGRDRYICARHADLIFQELLKLAVKAQHGGADGKEGSRGG